MSIINTSIPFLLTIYPQYSQSLLFVFDGRGRTRHHGALAIGIDLINTPLDQVDDEDDICIEKRVPSSKDRSLWRSGRSIMKTKMSSMMAEMKR